MPTALITGATSGIGASFANLLVRAGYDVVLVARDVNRLEQMATRLRRTPDVKAEVLPADLTDDAQRAAVEQRLADPSRAVDVLINNAGIALNRSVTGSTADAEESMLRLNVLAVLRLSKAAVPGMVERGHGAIINVSSVAGYIPNGTYSASKAWVTSFSQGLALSLRPKGVRVVALCPGYVRTEFQDRAEIDLSALPDWVWLDPDAVAAAGWRAVREGRTVAVVDGRYRAAVALLRLVPAPVLLGGLKLAQRRGLSR